MIVKKTVKCKQKINTDIRGIRAIFQYQAQISGIQFK